MTGKTCFTAIHKTKKLFQPIVQSGNYYFRNFAKRIKFCSILLLVLKVMFTKKRHKKSQLNPMKNGNKRELRELEDDEGDKSVL